MRYSIHQNSYVFQGFPKLAIEKSKAISAMTSFTWSQDGTETQAAVVAVGPSVVTVGRTTIPATADPTAPSMHPINTQIWASWVSHAPTRKGT